MSQFWRGRGHCLSIPLVRIIDYKGSILVYQTIDLKEYSVLVCVEGKSKPDQRSLVKQCQQLAHDGEKVIALNKHEGLPNVDRPLW